MCDEYTYFLTKSAFRLLFMNKYSGTKTSWFEIKSKRNNHEAMSFAQILYFPGYQCTRLQV